LEENEQGPGCRLAAGWPQRGHGMKCKNCGEEIESIFYHGHGHNWRHIGTSLFMCMKDRKPIRGHKNYFEAEPISENKEKVQSK
jgi:hypothetical protein